MQKRGVGFVYLRCGLLMFYWSVGKVTRHCIRLKSPHNMDFIFMQDKFGVDLNLYLET